MKILHLLNDVRELGTGIVNVAVDLACLQAKSGCEVSVASAGGDYEALLNRYGVQHIYLNQQRRPLALLQAALKYRSIVYTLKPDIVHVHMITGMLLAWGLQGRYKIVSTIHNEFQRSAVVMGLADRVIGVSQAVAASMQQRGIPVQKLRVVRNGTIGSPRWCGFDAAIALPLQRPAITCVAGMTQRKGIADLIQAFEQIAPQFPQAHLYLVGYGPDWQTFKQQAEATAVSDRVHLEGFQPRPFEYLKATDIFVLASRQEPFGLVLAEARQAGCAIIATQVDGIPEVLEGGKAGVLVPPANPAAIATALTRLLSQPTLLQHWQHQAQQNLDWLSVTRMHQDTLAVYTELIS